MAQIATLRKYFNISPNDIFLSVLMLKTILLSVVVLSVMAPYQTRKFCKRTFTNINCSGI
jgi:hypothetical protein